MSQFPYMFPVCHDVFFFFSSRRRHTRLQGDWSSDVCSSDLLKVLTDSIDVPARQVVISALVVEINRDRFHELGITFRDTSGRETAEFKEDPATGLALPFTFTYNEGVMRTAFQLTATLKVLITAGQAEIL